MKQFLFITALCGALLSISACAKEDTATQTTAAVSTAADKVANNAVEAAEKVAQDAKEKTQQALQKNTVPNTSTSTHSSTHTKVDAVTSTGKPAVKGQEYLELDTAVPTDVAAGKIAVLEFFWYRCPHCAKFEPDLEAWRKTLGEDVVFERVPVFFGRPGMQEEQRLYYALDAMGLTEQLQEKLFRAIHVEKKQLVTPDQMAAWLSQQGVDANKFKQTFKSFGVNSKIQRANKLMNQYMVDGVPALAIGGKYYTSPSIAKSETRALEVANQLIQKARAQ